MLYSSTFIYTKRIGTYFLVLFLIFQSSSSFSQAPPNIVFMGDSFTAGDGVAKSSTFVGLVSAQFKQSKVMNQGRSGWPTTSFLKRWKEVEKKLPPSVDVVFIQLGGNDLRVDGQNKQTIKQCQKNMKEIANRLATKFPDAKIVLMSSVKVEEATLTANIREAGFSEKSNKYLRQIGRTYKKLAKKESYAFLDLIAPLPPNSTHDGVHLNENGHKVIAKVLIDYLNKVI